MSLAEFANQIAAAKPPTEEVSLGPWLGSMRSKSADQVPRTHAVGTTNHHYLPRTGTFKRRKGQAIKFDTLVSSVGLLTFKSTMKCRQLEEFDSDGLSIPTLIALCTRETVTTGLDNGRFSQVWLRDQVNDLNYTLGSEFSAVTYPEPSSLATLRFVPLWNDSGYGGINRGSEEYQRRFFATGARGFKKVGNWWYFPNAGGMPFRWDGNFNSFASLAEQIRPAAITLNSGISIWSDQVASSVGADLVAAIDEVTPNDADYVLHDTNLGTLTVQLPATTDPGMDTGHTLRMRVKISSDNGDQNDRLLVDIAVGTSAIVSGLYWPGAGHVPSATPPGTDVGDGLTTSFETYEYEMTEAEAAQIRTTGVGYADIRISFAYYTGIPGRTVQVSWLEFEIPGAGTLVGNRLIPSGPLPPLHAGTIAAGTQVENSASYAYPTSDITDGSWFGVGTGVTTDLYSYIDEVVPDDVRYITSPTATGNQTCEVKLGDIGVVPSSDDNVIVRYRARISNLAVSFDAALYQGAVLIRTWPVSPGSTAFADYGVQLTPDNISDITDWTDLRVRFIKESGGSSLSAQVGSLRLEHTAGASTFQQTLEGGWRGSDKFYYSVAYRFEDDSIWMPCMPRGPNANLAAGFNLFTVDSANPTAGYRSITWSNIPLGPHGTKSRIPLRSLKIDSSTQSTLTLNPRDLRVVTEIKDNVTTTYEDFFADDLSLKPDPDGLLIRLDHQMTPRSRYLAAGDVRAAACYGSINPGAFEFAPVGYDAAYDRNVPESTALLYDTKSFYYRILSDRLELISDSGAALSTNTLAFATYTTIEDLVDGINATTISSSGKQWRAQVLPGANGRAATSGYLTLTMRTIASCVVNNTAKTIIKTAGGLSVVAVGSWIEENTANHGAYVTGIVDDTQLTYLGTLTTATASLDFNVDGGDSPTGLTKYGGYVRALGNCLPSFAYFNTVYLDLFPTQKSTTWLTVASPGAVKCAPNCWRDEIGNKHIPAEDIGIAMGTVAIDNGFVTIHSRGTMPIRNTRDAGTGIDQDYKASIMNKHRGCCAWGSVAQGNGFGVFCSPEGIIACDLFNEIMLSGDIYQFEKSEAVTPTGDFAYEIPLSIAGTAADDDTAYLSCDIARSALIVHYRASGSHPNRDVVYDFSAGRASSGLDALVRDEPLIDAITGRVVADSGLYGWGLPLVRSVSAVTEGRRSDGAHLYGWNEENAGSAGDGRISEIEIGDTDDGTGTATAIAGTLVLPWIQAGDDKLSVQEIVAWHTSPAGSTGALEFWRSFAAVAAAQSLTPSTSSSVVVKDRKLLQMSVRPVSDAFHLRWSQATGGARELKKILVKCYRTVDRRPAA